MSYQPETFTIDDNINLYQPTFNITDEGNVLCEIDGDIIDPSLFTVVIDEINWKASISLNQTGLGSELKVYRNLSITETIEIIGYGKNNIRDLEKVLFEQVINQQNLRFLIDYFISPTGDLIWKLATTTSAGYITLKIIITPKTLNDKIEENRNTELQEVKDRFELLFDKIQLLDNEVVVSNKVMLEVLNCPINSDVFENQYYVRDGSQIHKDEYPDAYNKAQSAHPTWIVGDTVQLPTISHSNQTAKFYFFVKNPDV